MLCCSCCIWSIWCGVCEKFYFWDIFFWCFGCNFCISCCWVCGSVVCSRVCCLRCKMLLMWMVFGRLSRWSMVCDSVWWDGCWCWKLIFFWLVVCMFCSCCGKVGLREEVSCEVVSGIVCGEVCCCEVCYGGFEVVVEFCWDFVFVCFLVCLLWWFFGVVLGFLLLVFFGVEVEKVLWVVFGFFLMFLLWVFFEVFLVFLLVVFVVDFVICLWEMFFVVFLMLIVVV